MILEQFQIITDGKGVSNVVAKRTAIWTKIQAAFNNDMAKDKRALWDLKKLKNLRNRMLRRVTDGVRVDLNFE